jgi:hypothetical protein
VEIEEIDSVESPWALSTDEGEALYSKMGRHFMLIEGPTLLKTLPTEMTGEARGGMCHGMLGQPIFCSKFGRAARAGELPLEPMLDLYMEVKA